MAKLISVKGAIVYMPPGWSAPSGYGGFKLYGTCVYDTTGSEYNFDFFENISYNFRVGYSSSSSVRNNYIYLIYEYNGGNKSNILSDTSKDIQIFFDDVDFPDATNSLLLQWILDNNAIIEGGIWEEEPEYILRIDGVEVIDYENVIINGVSYKCKGKPLISFTIDGISYQAEEGMTWGEWVNTEYNTIGASIYNEINVCVDEKYLALANNVIIANGSYTIIQSGGDM